LERKHIHSPAQRANSSAAEPGWNSVAAAITAG